MPKPLLNSSGSVPLKSVFGGIEFREWKYTFAARRAATLLGG
jgi:hypothetical protein